MYPRYDEHDHVFDARTETYLRDSRWDPIHPSWPWFAMGLLARAVRERVHSAFVVQQSTSEGSRTMRMVEKEVDNPLDLGQKEIRQIDLPRSHGLWIVFDGNSMEGIGGGETELAAWNSAYENSRDLEPSPRD